MTDAEAAILTLKQYETAQDYIKSVMHASYLKRQCNNALTIEAGNKIWSEALKKAKTVAYAALDIRVRQDVIDRIDAYWEY